MKLLLINVVCGVKSTGRICTDIGDYMIKHGHEVKVAYGRERVPQIYQSNAVRIGKTRDIILHGIKKLLFDGDGRGSYFPTKKFIKWIEDYDPDVIHLHNILGYYINLPVLFEYLNTSKKKTIWTLHDCSAFTGGCAYFEKVNCNKWLEKCENCPQKGKLKDKVLIDRSKKRLLENQKMYAEMDNLTIVTPSYWLRRYVEQSILGSQRIHVIHNGVDTNVFEYKECDLKEKLGISDKKIVLGVASPWSNRKGLADFIKLFNMLNPNEYRIILIGLTSGQKRSIPSGIIGVQRTDSVEELAKYYSIADVFVNPTYEDNYPTTNLESIACGTPVITYDTGGSSESAALFGSKVQTGNVEELYKKIRKVCEDKDSLILSKEIRKSISKDHMIYEYEMLYNSFFP